MIGPQPIVPLSFQVPVRVETDEFVVRPLAMERFHLDFESYMSSVEHLQRTWDLDGSDLTLDGERWPANSDIEFAAVDAAWCQFEWQILRSSFTYTALTKDERQQLGCGYIFRSSKQGYDLECQTWVRASRVADGFDQRWFDWFRNWVETEWPYKSLTIGWPGREIGWDEWNAIPRIGWDPESL